MDFKFSDDQRAIREAVIAICRPFDNAYWLNKDLEGGFPHDFHAAFAQAGWLGIAMPTAYGGAGLGIAEAVGLGRVALQTAAKYARERIVFDRPIGQNQGIQHPLARCWIDLEAAALLYQRAAWLYDSGQPCGAEASAAKYFAGEAGYRACEAAVLSHGGMGYAKEFHVERYFRESMLPRIAPVSAQLVLSFIAEKILGMPKSY